jgi:hypothetical protein
MTQEIDYMLKQLPQHSKIVAPLIAVALMSIGGCPFNSGTASNIQNSINNADPNQTASQTLSRIYGDGSAGARVIDRDLRLGDQGDINLQYTDFTIEPGVILTVQSGTVIRCIGEFTNNGTIIVQSGANGGDRRSTGSSSLANTTRSPVSGLSTLTAAAGEITNSGAAVFGGEGGVGLSEFETRTTNFASVVAVGAGGAAAVGDGGSGGGGLAVFAAQTLTNDGAINADGQSAPDGGGGGGGGGGVLLASREMVVNTSNASISAVGGDGGAATSEAAPGGAGGGGVVHMIAPLINNTGAADVSGGSAGPSGAENSIASDTRAAGAGGGASAGNGGTGGDISAGVAPTPSDATGGTAGFILETLIDPSAVL